MRKIRFLIENNEVKQSTGYSLYSFWSENNVYNNNNFSNGVYFKGDGYALNFDDVPEEIEKDAEFTSLENDFPINLAKTKIFYILVLIITAMFGFCIEIYIKIRRKIHMPCS